MKISIVIPVYNGEKTIAKLVDELLSNLTTNKLEIVLVNDGSKDNSHEKCVKIYNKFKNTIKYICLARNFGEHNAVLAGLNNVTGDYAVIIDDDFQNPPDEIQKLIDFAINGRYDVVYSYYDKKFHSWFRNLGSNFNNLIANYLLDKPKDLYLSSFKCMNRFLIYEIIKYKGPFPYIDGLILRITQNIGKIKVKHVERTDGISGYTLRKLVGLWLNMFINFSIYPLRISTFFGSLFSALGGILIVYSIIERFVHPEVPTGVTSIFVAILFFSGIQLLTLGLIGEYVGKISLTNNQSPQYVIRQILTNEVNDINE